MAAVAEYERFLFSDVRKKINTAFLALGFKFVALDLEPFRSGRMNEAAGVARPEAPGVGKVEGFSLPVVR